MAATVGARQDPTGPTDGRGSLAVDEQRFVDGAAAGAAPCVSGAIVGRLAS
jgi:hypothetical protein